jgi:hypothetical protein
MRPDDLPCQDQRRPCLIKPHQVNRKLEHRIGAAVTS